MLQYHRNKRGLTPGDLVVWIVRFGVVAILLIIMAGILWEYGQLPQDTARHDFYRFKNVFLTSQECGAESYGVIDTAKITDKRLQNCFSLPQRAFFITLSYNNEKKTAAIATQVQQEQRAVCNSFSHIACETFTEYVTVKRDDKTYVPGILTVEVMRNA